MSEPKPWDMDWKEALLSGFRELPEGYFYGLPMPIQQKLSVGFIGLEYEVEVKPKEAGGGSAPVKHVGIDGLAKEERSER